MKDLWIILQLNTRRTQCNNGTNKNKYKTRMNMKNMKLILGIGLAIFFSGCVQNHRENAMDASDTSEVAEYAMKKEIVSEEKMSEKGMSAEASPIDYVSSSAAVVSKQDSTRKIIRTAELRFKVKDVIRSTYDIEDITVRHGGFVVYTHLSSEVNNVTTTAISTDSSLVTTYYTVINTLNLKVPNVKLDTALKEIARNIDFLDFRNIQAKDVTLQILGNDLTRKRIAKIGQRLVNAIDNRGRKLEETTSAEELLLEKLEQADNAIIENLSLEDHINFSTISLYIYQRQTIKREMIPSEKNIDAYEPGFGSKAVEAFRFGWNVCIDIILFIVEIWWLIVLVSLAFLIFRNYKQKNKKKQE
jgi:hypothetical protein